MPVINIEVLQDIWGGSEDVDARITATVNRASVDAYRVNNQFVIFPRDLIIPVVNGLPTQPFVLTALPISYYWHIDVFVMGEAPLRRTVIVPEGAGPFNFEDLIDVDPGTAQPDPGANAYQAWLDQMTTASLHNVPAGGTTGQVLTKVNGEDFNTEWADGSSGSGNNALIKSGHWNYPSPNGVAIQPTEDGESIALKSSSVAALRWHIRDGGPSVAGYSPEILSINNPLTDGNAVTFDISTQEVAPPLGYHYGVSISTGDQQYNGSYVAIASTTTTLTLDYLSGAPDSFDRTGITGYIWLPSVYNQVEAREDGVWVKNANWSETPSYANYWHFKTDGSIQFPYDSSNARAGSGEILQFGDSNNQSIITGPPAQDGFAAQRIVVQGQNGSATGGEGGDVYLWAGSGEANDATGGDIKVDAGQGVGTGEGGTVKVRGGYTPDGVGGSIEITSGYSTNGTGGSVHVNASGGGVTGGDIQLNTFNQTVGQRSWTFNDSGELTFPDGSTHTGSSTTSNASITLSGATGEFINDSTNPDNQIATIGDLAAISLTPGPQGEPGPVGVVAASSPATYDSGTQTVGVDQNGFTHISTLDYIQMDVTNTTSPVETGRMAWNGAEGTLDLKLQNGVTLQVGQETVAMVANYTGSHIPEGAAVYVVGAQGQRLKVALADASAESTSSTTIGVVTHTGGIAHGSSGYITTQGLVHDLHIPSSAFAEGDIIWLSTTAGQWTSTRPEAPDHGVQIGYVVKTSNGSAGQIYVHPQAGYELNEIHNVKITNPQVGDVLKFNGTIWTNQRP